MRLQLSGVDVLGVGIAGTQPFSALQYIVPDKTERSALLNSWESVYLVWLLHPASGGLRKSLWVAYGRTIIDHATDFVSLRSCFDNSLGRY